MSLSFLFLFSFFFFAGFEMYFSNRSNYQDNSKSREVFLHISLLFFLRISLYWSTGLCIARWSQIIIWH
ncbi:hypothetical protein C2G38_2103009 [Gigaspora rosea]|uniref:Uncharacterized protein n=1 Tax=Gigaspora rosea TaxID=44941 RepID=A0A397UN60_9GLOM|nr:hypothetical protein C2G38_2103009 [Gigaspora rosea]